ncbi:MAG: divalent-cation tolerance protein CutA [Pseudomonadota bacterium]
MAISSSRDPIVVITTLPNPKDAKMLAHQVIERRLAACCNIIPSITSIYRWKGELIEDQECLLEIKTVKGRYSKLDNLIHQLHPYDLPMVVSLPITGSNQYISWIQEQTS